MPLPNLSTGCPQTAHVPPVDGVEQISPDLCGTVVPQSESFSVGRRVAIHQPNYAPWIGYFAKMAIVDTFVFLDDCQMPIGRSYVSRVQVMGRDDAEWMTAPIRREQGQRIRMVRFADRMWAKKHLGTLRANYARSLFYDEVIDLLRPIYEDPGEFLADFNVRIIRALAGYLGLFPRFYLESEFSGGGVGTRRLIELVRCFKGTTYVSGSGGTKYQNPDAFLGSDIALEIRRYRPVNYTQPYGEFVPGLSVLDAVFHLGPEARALLTYRQLVPEGETATEVTAVSGSVSRMITQYRDDSP